MAEGDEERLLGALLADIEGGRQAGVVDFAIEVGLRPSHLGPIGGRIWRAALDLKRSGRPFDLQAVANAVNSDGTDGETVTLSQLVDLAGVGTSQGRFLVREVVGRALLKDALEFDGSLDIPTLTKHLTVLDEENTPPVMEDFGTLLDTEFPPLRWIVQDVIVRPGLTFLAGRAKAGKSWLALQLAHCVATGEDFLGRSVDQGIVLYLALEDGRKRTHKRLKAQGWERTWAPAVLGVYKGIKLDETGRNMLARMIEDAEPSLVVIDALAKVLPEGVKENSNEDMARVLYPISDLANQRDCSILIVHHMPKGAKGEVIGSDLRGASSIYAAGDGVVALYREGKASEARLAVQGRDMEDLDMAIGWSGLGLTWAYIGGPEVLGQRAKKRKVIEALREMGESTAKDVAEESGMSSRWAKTLLDEMVKDGLAKTGVEGTKGRSTTVYIWTGD